MTKIILKLYFITQSIGIAVLLIFGMWKVNIFGWTLAENAVITAWIATSIVSIVAYSAISLYKKLRHEED